MTTPMASRTPNRGRRVTPTVTAKITLNANTPANKPIATGLERSRHQTANEKIPAKTLADERQRTMIWDTTGIVIFNWGNKQNIATTAPMMVTITGCHGV